MEALSRSNQILGVYICFLYFFGSYLRKLGSPRKIKILEIGSGFGGLTERILRKFSPRMEIEAHLMDLDPLLLERVQSRLFQSGFQVHVHPSGETHLRQFADQEFDLVISLQVLHHIHPRSVLLEAFQESLRVSKLGFFHMDLEDNFSTPFLMWMFRHLFRFHPILVDDGEKSFLRAYTKEQFESTLQDAVRNLSLKHTQVTVRRILPLPYHISTAIHSGV